ncbi:DUF2911 domain-containing protein [Flavobacteriaceae bacterium F89]|uniref:DUF2911 domain-containing protein n=1 Tax=Cerina litoralis TaxID=2874477 RepID=A0AAE3EY53_9FLAO|nr:DUF2911 domain-containing protein [Cerina litoralis]MCG2461872.1 DUF2911 domain-containing protein [Cerina litoralis]
MKNLMKLGILLLTLVFSSTATAQKFSGLDKSPMDQALYPDAHSKKEALVRITYSRPQLKGRSLTELAPMGQVWRTGANEADEIVFYKDAKFGDKDIKAGSYSLFTIPGPNEWTIILNSNLNQWGAYSYDEAADVIRTTAKVGKGSAKLEAFSIAYDGKGDDVNMVLGWGTTRVTVPISF